MKTFDRRQKGVRAGNIVGEHGKPTFTVLMCDDQISDFTEAVIRSDLEAQYQLKFERFRGATEFLRLAHEQPFDLIFLYVSNVDWDVGIGSPDPPTRLGCDTDHEKILKFIRAAKAVVVLGDLRGRFHKPIIATQGYDLAEQFKRTGVDFLKVPFGVEQFRRTLQLCLND